MNGGGDYGRGIRDRQGGDEWRWDRSVDGTAKEIHPEDDVKDDEGLDGMHVSEGSQGSGVGISDNAGGSKVEQNDEGATRRNEDTRIVADGGVDEDVPEGDKEDDRFELGHDHEKYTVMRDKIMAWAMNKAKGMGGPVPMEVGGVDGEWEDEGWDEGGEAEAVDAVYPTTRCYNCQGYGHGEGMSAQGGRKRRYEGRGQGRDEGWIQRGRQRGKQGRFGKGEWGKGGNKGDNGFKGFGKGNVYAAGSKGGGKGFGYQGTCSSCG